MPQEIETVVMATVIGLALMVSTAIGREALGEYKADRETETTYIFTSRPDTSTVYLQILNVLEIYKFPIERTKGNRYVETGWTDIKRWENKLFTVKYRITIEERPTRITVVAETKGASSRHARNAPWWLIKKIVRMTGR